MATTRTPAARALLTTACTSGAWDGSACTAATRGITLYREAEAIAVEAMPRIPLYFDTRLTLVKPWVKGFWGSALRPHRVEYLWIDPAWQRESSNEPAFLPLELPPPGRLSP